MMKWWSQTTVVRGWALVILATMVLLNIGCGRGFEARGANSRVWIPWPNSQGIYALQAVPLLSVSSPETLSSARARVFYQAGAKSSGFNGAVVRPRLTRARNFWVPLDVGSGVSLAAFAIMERLFDFDQRFGVLNRLSWPRQIGVEIAVDTDRGALINNALYDSEMDVIAVAPYLKSQTPASVNHGILAHEHFHAHFAAAMQSRFSRPERANDMDLGIASVNRLVMLGWNEGLADYYAYVFTNDPAFIRETFPDSTPTRQLTGELLSLHGWNEVQARMNSGNLSFSYENGTAMARWLYRWGKSDQAGPEKILALIHQRLPGFLQKTNLHLSESPLSPAALLEDLVNGSDLPLSAEICTDLRSVVSKVEPRPQFKRCL